MKPKWFQIHLSTAVVLMFVAAILLWLNLREQRNFNPEGFDGFNHLREWGMLKGRGFPFCAYESLTEGVFIHDLTIWYRSNLYCNAAIAIVTLMGTFIGCEHLIRRPGRSRLPEEPR